MRSLKIALFVGLATAIVACSQGEATKYVHVEDSGGQRAQISLPKQAGWHKSQTTMPLFFGTANITYKSSLRDNGRVMIDYYFMNDQLFLTVEHIPRGRFMRGVDKQLLQTEQFRSQFSNIIKSQSQIVKIDEDYPKAIKGHVYQVGDCWAVGAGLRLGTYTSRYAARPLDTVIHGAGCGLLRKPIEEVIRTLAANKTGYNDSGSSRAIMAHWAKLRKKGL